LLVIFLVSAGSNCLSDRWVHQNTHYFTPKARRKLSSSMLKYLTRALTIKKFKFLIKCLRAIKNLTNRSHVAVRLFSNRSQMTSEFEKNTKKVAHEAIVECVTDVYDVIYTSVLQLILGMNKSKGENNSTCFIKLHITFLIEQL